jgi:hypothetical protein
LITLKRGVWGIAGRNPRPIHYCVGGHTICGTEHRPGPSLKLIIQNWKPEYKDTCRICKARYELFENAESSEPAEITEKSLLS